MRTRHDSSRNRIEHDAIRTPSPENQSPSFFTELWKNIWGSLEAECEEIKSFLRADYEPKDADEFSNDFEDIHRKVSDFSDWNQPFFVTPSGSPGQRRHLKLNYPTYRTQRHEI